MSRTPPNFRVRDLHRALETLRAAGESVAAIHFDKAGGFVVRLGVPSNSTESVTPLDTWMKDHADQA